MALPTGPASRPRKKPVHSDIHEAHPNADAQLFEPQSVEQRPAEQRLAPTVRNLRIPSEILPRDMLMSPAVLGLSLADFLDLHYQDSLKTDDITVEDFFRMRDNGAFPDPFTAGDPRSLFTEDICRRGQFVPVGWHTEGVYFGTSKAENAQDELAKALDLLVKMPVTLYTLTPDQVEAGIGWLYRK